MVLCLTSARFNMTADVLRQTDGITNPTSSGIWKSKQDPITGEVVRTWVSDYDVVNPANQGVTFSVDCLVRALSYGGPKSQGDIFGDMVIDNFEYVTMEFGSGVLISQRDKITNIRTTKTGNVIWKEEETTTDGVTFAPTVFDVKAIVPQVDPFGNHSSSIALLERSNVQ